MTKTKTVDLVDVANALQQVEIPAPLQTTMNEVSVTFQRIVELRKDLQDAILHLSTLVHADNAQPRSRVSVRVEEKVKDRKKEKKAKSKQRGAAPYASKVRAPKPKEPKERTEWAHIAGPDDPKAKFDMAGAARIRKTVENLGIKAAIGVKYPLPVRAQMQAWLFSAKKKDPKASPLAMARLLKISVASVGRLLTMDKIEINGHNPAAASN